MSARRDLPGRPGALRLGLRTGPMPLRAIAGASGSGALSAACAIGLLGTSGWLITRASQRPPVLSLAIAIGAVQAFALGRGAFRYLQRLGAHGMALDTLSRLRVWLYEVIEPLTPNGLPARGAGAIVNGFVGDTETTTQAVARAMTASVDVAASILLGAAVAGLLAPVTAVALLVASLVVLGVSLLSTRLGRGANESAAGLRAELADAVVETLRSAPELVVHGREELVAERLALVHARSRSAALHRAAATGAGSALATWAAGAGLIGVVLAGLAAHRTGQLSGVMLAVLGFVALAVLDQCAALPTALAGVAAGDAAAARLAGLARLRPPVREPAHDRSSAAAGPAAALVGVDVRPPSGDGDRPILREVTLTVPPHGRVALTGRSGAGKSSVLHLLLHLLEAARGSVTLGGVDVREMTREGIARWAAWLPEETHVFAATLTDNLRLARPDAGDADCVEALERVGLGPWARSLPEGMRTLLGAGGRPLSAGERQRLGMARALLSGAPLLLLDEPTAHIDPGAAPHLLSELLGAAGARSVLVVSHRPEVAEQVDAVVTLDAGEVVATAAGPRPPQYPGRRSPPTQVT